MTSQLDIFPLKSFNSVEDDPNILDGRRFSKIFHNTTEKKGVELERAQVKASGQTEIILKVFQQHPRTSFTPWDVWMHLGQQMMITSVRRAITTLTDAGYLVKTEERRKSGPAEETNFTWKLK